MIMRIKSLFYLLLAMSCILVACNKTSDDGYNDPAPNVDVTLEAKYLLTEYWGDMFTPGVDNYSVIIAENEFKLDIVGPLLTEGSYYCLDLYAPITEDGNLPAGTYTLDMSESCAEWSIDGTVSCLIMVDANGNFIPDDEGIAFSEATLVVEDDYAELTAVIDGKTHFVTFSGEFARLDSTNGSGDIISTTTLLNDVEVEGDDAMFIAVLDEGVAQIIVTENSDANGAMFMFEVVLAEGSDSISGTYSVADGTMSMGTYNEDGMWGSWYLNFIDGELGDEYAAIHDGSVTFVQDGDSCQMILDCSDAKGYAIKATLSGMFVSQSLALGGYVNSLADSVLNLTIDQG